MNEAAKTNNELQVSNVKSELELMTENLLLDTISESDKDKTIKVPISELTTLGAAVSSLVPKMVQITQTISLPTDKLYRLANQSVGEVLKQAKDGDFGVRLKGQTVHLKC